MTTLATIVMVATLSVLLIGAGFAWWCLGVGVACLMWMLLPDGAR